jgi:RimJ/RimL family protein N-acetyltransferase
MTRDGRPGDPIPADGVILRPLRTDDAPAVAAACSDPLTQRFVPALPDPYTVADAMWWITEGAPRTVAEGGSVHVIADPRTDALLGVVGLNQVFEATAYIGYWVAPWARRRGVATAATRALARHAFAHGVQRLALTTDPANTASQRVAIAAGFTREGVARAGGPSRLGGREDRIVWSRLPQDPDRPSHRLLPDLPAPGELTDGVIVLRPLGPNDAADTLALRHLPDVVATSVPAVAPDAKAIDRLCATADAGWLAGERANFTIRDAATGAYAGEIGLYYWEPPTGQAMIGYSMVPAWRGRGYATRAAKLVAAWAFTATGIARVIAGTAPDNVGSQRVLERAGFVREGYQRSRLPGPDGGRIDDILYALLPSTGTSGSEGSQTLITA